MGMVQQRPMVLLVAAALVLALWTGRHVPTPLRSIGEAHCGAVAAGLDRALSDAPPDCVVILNGLPASLSDFSRLGPILKSRCRVTTVVPTGGVCHFVSR